MKTEDNNKFAYIHKMPHIIRSDLHFSLNNSKYFDRIVPSIFDSCGHSRVEITIVIVGLICFV